MPIDRLPPSEPNAPAALLTPPGRGAVATIRCAGDGRRIDAARLFHAANGKLLAEQTVGRILFGWWNTHPPEDVVVCRTDEATVEIHCHGGDAAARRILDDLAATGFTVQTWQAELAARGGRFAAECAELLARTTTLRTAEIALEQQTAWPQAVGSLQTALRSGQHDDLRNVVAAIDRLLARAEFGRRLTQPANVVLAGRPNVGKSSLTNALLGYARSIVFDQPGTTRDVVTAETALDGWPVRFSDTAGLRSVAEPLEAAGIDRARQHLSAADCRLLLLDCSRPPHADDEQLLADWPDSIIVAHKCDLPNQWHDQTPPAALHVSSITGEGLEELMQNIVARLIPEPPSPAAPIPFTPRQLDRLQQARKAIQEQTPHIAATHLAEITNEPSLPTGFAPVEK